MDSEWPVPSPRNPNFVDRPGILRAIEEDLSQPGHSIALVGVGGIGKTAIAIEYCHRRVKTNPKTKIIWIDAGSISKFEKSVACIINNANVKDKDSDTGDARRLLEDWVEDWLLDEKTEDWCIVLDDVVDDVVDLPARDGRKTILNCLTEHKRGSVLVTTRVQHFAKDLVTERKTYLINSMDTGPAIALFTATLGAQSTSTSSRKRRADLELLVAQLGKHPLAVQMAANYMRENGLTAKQYSAQLRLRRLQVKSNPSFIDARELAAIWDISFERIKRERPSAANLLSLISRFDGIQGIPSLLVKGRYFPDSDLGNTAIQEDTFERDMKMLQDYSLISVTSSEKGDNEATLFIHRLVQRATTGWLAKDGQLAKWSKLSIMALDSTLLDGNFENWEILRALMPHVRGLLHWGLVDREDRLGRASILYKAARFALTLDSADLAEWLIMIALRDRQKFLGHGNPDTLDCMDLCVTIYSQQKRWDRAEHFNERVLGLRHMDSGSVDPSTLVTLTNLANLSGQRGDWAVSIKIYRRVLEVKEARFGKDSPDTLTSVSNLASAYGAQGRWSEATELHERVLKSRQKFLGLEHPDTVASFNDLASTYDAQGRVAESIELQQHALRATKGLFGSEHPLALEATQSLAVSYLKVERTEDASEMLEQVFELRSISLGADHPKTLESAQCLASAHAKRSHHTERVLPYLEDMYFDVDEDSFDADDAPSLTYSSTTVSYGLDTDFALWIDLLRGDTVLVSSYGRASSYMTSTQLMHSISQTLGTFARDLETEASSTTEKEKAQYILPMKVRNRIAEKLLEVLKLFQPTLKAVDTETTQASAPECRTPLKPSLKRMRIAEDWIQSITRISESPPHPDKSDNIEPPMDGNIEDMEVAFDDDQGWSDAEAEIEDHSIVISDEDRLRDREDLMKEQAEDFVYESKAFATYKSGIYNLSLRTQMFPIRSLARYADVKSLHPVYSDPLLLIDVDNHGESFMEYICTLEELFFETVTIPQEVSENLDLWSQFDILATGLRKHQPHLDLCQPHPDLDANLESRNVHIFYHRGLSAIFSRFEFDISLTALQKPFRDFDHVKERQKFRDSPHVEPFLGSLSVLFSELLTFILKGKTGVKQFRSLDTYLELDLWLDELADMDRRARELVSVVSLLQKTGKRSLASIQTSREMEVIRALGMLRVMEKLRMTSTCHYWDGNSVVRLIGSRFVPQLSRSDHFKQLVEACVKTKVDWAPFQEGKRSCSANDIRLAWLWYGTELFIDIPVKDAQDYRDSWTSLSNCWNPYPNTPNYAAASQPGGYYTGASGFQTQSSNQGSIPGAGGSQQAPQVPAAAYVPSTTASVGTSPKYTPSDPPALVYWCIDRCWQQVSQIRRSIIDTSRLTDQDFFIRLKEDYELLRGTWLLRLFDLRCCVGIRFIMFITIDEDDADLVDQLEEGLPPRQKYPTYEYVLHRNGEKHHCRIAGHEIFKGLQDPHRPRGLLRDTLSKVPKDKTHSPCRQGQEAWGIRAIHGLSLKKTMYWILGVNGVGLAFVIFWLILVDKTDLQNAFAPVLYFNVPIGLALAIPYYLGLLD